MFDVYWFESQPRPSLMWTVPNMSLAAFGLDCGIERLQFALAKRDFVLPVLAVHPEADLSEKAGWLPRPAGRQRTRRLPADCSSTPP
jgi:hypothetical protein